MMTNDIFGADAAVYRVRTKAAGPAGALPLTPEMLMERPSGDVFGMTQNAGMGWNPSELNRKQFLILSTQGGLRAPDGKPIALGFHTGHWEIGLLVKEAAEELRRLETLPFAAYCSDPCDGRTQGTTGMFDSLPYRNDAAIIFRRLIRSLPTRRGVIGVATCDKGLPAMMMALAGMRDLPCVLAPGCVTLPPIFVENAGKVQTLSALFSHGLISLQVLSEPGCVAFASPVAGLRRPTVHDWTEVNRRVPRLVDVLPNGPTHHPTVRVFLAGGVPEVMLHLRTLGVLDTNVLTVTGQTLGEVLRVWEKSERREKFRQILKEQDGVDPDDVILPPARAREKGLTSTVTFPIGNLAPEGSV